MADPQIRPEVTNALGRLMAADYDPAGITDDDLIAAAVDAREAKKRAELAAAVGLSQRGWSWRRIGKALGVDHTTAYGWVRDAGMLPNSASAGEPVTPGPASDEDEA